MKFIKEGKCNPDINIRTETPRKSFVKLKKYMRISKEFKLWGNLCENRLLKRAILACHRVIPIVPVA